ncbi:hypothetical protein BW247_13505 [Acidihalobacter ferrooxydans]|uniref:Uncharacterized protein n=1 Tax=Acidihalobacter ferrooxydans TaxID=1765967 RepID=A0A1P8UJK8_9GAMM|nr:hypothetical protein BW247_13505 [Acidihalobacter ferrooxydans]
MGDVVPFKRRSVSDKHAGDTLCRRGFHKWEVVKDKQFDVRHGKLVTIYRCVRCGKTRVETS